ncbi:MAG: hypothetical protein CMM54_00380, partial [Rhodospirillaceae bacterium]|nr:hypothetical protein [Rhodospirillaceae bacterium]
GPQRASQAISSYSLGLFELLLRMPLFLVPFQLLLNVFFALSAFFGLQCLFCSRRRFPPPARMTRTGVFQAVHLV